MKRKIAVPILLIASLMSGWLFAQQGNPGNNARTITGVISDSMCGGASHMAKDKTAAQCTRECVQSGEGYVLVVGKKTYTLKGDAVALDKYAGEEVTVKGTVSGDTITAESVSPAAAKKKS